METLKSLEETPRLEITYDQCEVLAQENRLILSGHVNIIYQDVSITADEILLDLESRKAEAKGNVILWQQGRQWFGSHLIYEFPTGSMGFSDTSFDGSWVFLKSPQVNVAESGKQIIAYNAEVTTCDLPIPHYHFKAGKVVVEPGERFQVYHSWLKIGNIPIAYVPYYSRSLDPEDPTWFFTPGHSNKKGFFALNRVNWTFNDYLRLRFYGDLYSELGPGFGIKEGYRAKNPDNLEGFIYAYYLDGTSDNDYIQGPPKTYREVEPERWKIFGKHWQRLTERTTLSAWYQALSDPEYNEDFRGQELIKNFDEYDLRYERNSFVNLAHRGEHYNYRLTAKARLNDFFLNDFPEEERLPQLRIDGIRRQLFDTPLYFKTSLEFTRFKLEQQRFSGPNTLRMTQEADRGDFDFELAYPFSLGSGFQLIPFTGYQATYYGDPVREFRYRDQDGREPDQSDVLREEFDDQFRNVGRVGVDLVNRFTSEWETPGSRRFDRMRIVTQPRLGFVYRKPDVDFENEQPERVTGPGTLPLLSRFPRDGFLDQTFDERDFPRRTEELLRLILESKFEGRRKNGSTARFARHSLELAYDFEPDDDPWNDLISELWLYPHARIWLSNFLRYDLNDSRLTESNTSLTVIPWERIRATVGLSTYDPGVDFDREEDLLLGLFFQMSDKYSLNYRHRYDLDASRSRENRLTITRDMHDLLTSVILREKNYEDRDHEFEVKLVVTFKLPGTGKQYDLTGPVQ